MDTIEASAPSRRALHTYVCLMRATSTVTDRVHGHLDEAGLTTSQFGVLEALLHLGPLPQRALCAKVLTSPNNMTTVIDKLEERALAERRPGAPDRRVKTVHLTRSGRSLARRVFARHAEVLARDFAVLSAAEQRELARLCKKLGKGAKS